MKPCSLIYFLLGWITITTCANAQSYNSPESVEFDYANNRWFISNNGNGQILARNSATGVLSVFATGIPSGPHGLEIVGDTLYACDGALLKAYDINTTTQLFNINLGATFLNGITHDVAGFLYLTDFSAKKIIRFNTIDRTFTVFAASTGTQSPNGIIYDPSNNRCVFVNWGTAAPIKALDLTTGAISTITTTTLGNCDGIARDNSGNYYVSSWSGAGKITRFNSTFTSSVDVVTAGLSSPADIFYNVQTDTLGVPNSGTGNNTAYYYFGTASSLNESADSGISLNVHIVDGMIEADYSTTDKGAVTLTLMDEAGRIIDYFSNSGAAAGKYCWRVERKLLGSYSIILRIGRNQLQRSIVVLE